MSIKTIIVDDVELARERIRILLDDDEIEIVGEATNGREAIKAIKDLQPDLVFLDIQMPKIGGFEVIETIGVEEMPTVIFVTAYDEFALRAFEINAVDYLMKPFGEHRLKKAVEKAKRLIKSKNPDSENIKQKLVNLLEEIRAEQKFLKRIPVKSARGTTLLPTEEIDWIGAAGHYLELHAGREIHLIREKISLIEEKLDPEIFIRIHRSTIVNVEQIKSLHPLFNGDQLIILKNGQELNLSRTYYDNLVKNLTF